MKNGTNIENQEVIDNLRKYISSKVRNKEDIEDILQDTLLKGLERGRLEEVDNLNNWLFHICKNSITDYYRKVKPSLTDQFVHIAEEEKKELDDFCCLDPHINALPEKYRKVIYLNDIKGLKHTEIAKKLNLGLSATKSRVARGRELLKSKFIECCQYQLDEQGKLVGEPSCQNEKCHN